MVPVEKLRAISIMDKIFSL